MPCDLSGRNLVAGLGATGLSVARHIARAGHEVVVVDGRAEPPALADLRRELPHVEVHTGTLASGWLDGAARLVVSPGLAADTPLIAAARARGIPVLGDIEVFARTTSVPVVAVTGSNGKSTVTTLVSRLLAAAGLRAPAGGNLGPPALDLLATEDSDVFVLEVSSFQMETTESLRPRAAAVLNVSSDHLDRHGSLAEYAGLKARLLMAAETAVANVDDDLVREMASGHPSIIACAVDTPLTRGFGLVERGGRPWLAVDRTALIACDALALEGRHNWLNALAALALASVFAAPGERVLEALSTFEGLPHRCRLVAEYGGVAYIDDSKATNVAAAVAAIRGLDGPLVLIAGGAGKGADFAGLAGALQGKVRAAFLIGEAARALADALSPHCAVSIEPDLEAAVRAARRIAAAGDTVLLSPACASTDMFTDYRHRGRAFAAAVEGLRP